MTKYNGKIYLFANWKMYLDYNESNILANGLAGEAKNIPNHIKMAVFPSALSLYNVSRPLKDAAISVGAQNVYWVDKGGYTGEVSAVMYKEAGCEYALVGHSERRHVFGETNHDVRAKMEAVLAAGLTPVLCVGEKMDEREADKAKEVVEVQLRSALDNLEWPRGRELIVAYEPVWAIGSGEACDPDEAERIHGAITRMIRGLVDGIDPIVLYGGSVRQNNVAEYLRRPGISGVLVGGASTKLDSWLDIVKNSIL